jgi:hypothetical protein
VTARDEATRAATDAVHIHFYNEAGIGVADLELIALVPVVLDAIRPFLVRLAIEQGALEPLDSSASTADGDLLFFNESEPLYRVVEP